MPAKVVLSGKMVCAECGGEVGVFQIAPCAIRMNTSFAITSECKEGCKRVVPTPGCQRKTVPLKMEMKIEAVEPLY